MLAIIQAALAYNLYDVVYVVAGLTCCSQNGGNSFRNPYNNMNHSMGTRMVAVKGQPHVHANTYQNS